MANEFVDMRRTDQRDDVRPSPFWMSSKVFTFEGNGGDNIMDDRHTGLFSFPKTKVYRIDAAILEISTLFAGGTVVMTIGHGTIATDDAVDGDTLSIVDAASIVTTAVAIPGTAGRKDCQSVVGATPLVLLGAAATVPIIYVTLTSGAAITAGEGRLHIQISEIDENVITS
jgi:hypothetical protein